jgi:hypothetical protein
MPYAYTISRPFRKEVCAFCFAYAFDATPSLSQWRIKYSSDPKGEYGTVWFCGQTCKERWRSEVDASGLMGKIYEAIERAARGMNGATGGKKKPATTEDMSSLSEKVLKQGLSKEIIDSAWTEAENRYGRPHFRIPILDDFELEVAKFLVSALVRRYSERDSQDTDTYEGPTWEEFMQLQDNELPHIRSRPLILDCHIRIYGFLVNVLSKISSSLLNVSEAAVTNELELIKAVGILRKEYLADSAMVRAILAREAGNTFGLWEKKGSEGGREMFGWGSYVSASFFNHGAPHILEYLASY